MLPVNIAKYLNPFYPSLTWQRKADEKVVYLTFDDGPHPEITQWVMDRLDEYSFKATFFCIGENLTKYPDVIPEIQRRGHRIGNHTLNHLSGYGASRETYVENVEKWHSDLQTDLFRPPYGRIRRSQIRALRDRYEIIMWSILSWDFKSGVDHGSVLRQMERGVKPGSIVVFHDSEKAENNLKAMLPPFCAYLASEGYRSEVL